jgi:hypothetical protein
MSLRLVYICYHGIYRKVFQFFLPDLKKRKGFGRKKKYLVERKKTWLKEKRPEGLFLFLIHYD